MTTIINNQLLDDLMNPNTASGREAEARFKAIELPTRIKSLMDVFHQSLALLTLSPSMSENHSQSFSPTLLLACVLLRRDISSLGTWVWLQAVVQEGQKDFSGAQNLCHDMLSLMSNIVDCLLEYFVHLGQGAHAGHHHFQRRDVRALQRHIGQVIAEACSCETWLYPLQQLVERSNQETAWTWTFALSSPSMAVTVLRAIGPACSVADKASLDLLSLLAQRAPLALQDNYRDVADGSLTFSLRTTLQSATQVSSEKWKQLMLQPQNQLLPNQSTEVHGEMLQILTVANSILEAMTYVYRASNVWQELRGQCEAGENLLVFRGQSNLRRKAVSTREIKSNFFQRYMMQMVQIQTKMCDVIGPHDAFPQVMHNDSNAAKTGSFGILFLLEIIHDACTRTNFISNYSTVDEVSTILQSLSQTASICPMLLSGSVDILHYTCRVLQSIATLTTDHLRLGAIHTLVTLLGVQEVTSLLQEHPHVLNLCINGEHSMIQNGSQSKNLNIYGVIRICAESIVNGVDGDVDSWAQSKIELYEDVAHSEDDDVAVFAQELLEEFLRCVGASKCLSSMLEIVQSLFDLNQWQASRGALCMLEVGLVSAPHSFSRHIPVTVETALKFSVPEECVRVQFQAIQLLAALCGVGEVDDETSAFCKQMNKVGVRNQFGHRILSNLVKAMRCCCTKVVGHACLALSAYCRGGRDETALQSTILPHLGDILMAITSGPLSLDVAENTDVFIRAFDAISSLAYVAKDAFTEFYPIIMPGLKECAEYGIRKDSDGNYIEGSRTQEIILLRGGAIDTASIVGQAIGDSNGPFYHDANYFMTLILSTLTSHEAAMDAPMMIPVDQLMTASARIASVIKEEYIPFLPKILPHLLHKLKAIDDVTITEGGANSIGQESECIDNDGTKSITVELPGMGMKKLVINSVRMQEKSEAARAIQEHARSIGLAFGPYTEECLSTFLPMLGYQYSADVRCAVAQALDPVFESACEYSTNTTHQSHVVSVPHKFFSPIVIDISKQLLEEDDDDLETIFALSEAMSNITYYAFNHAKTNVRSCMNCIEARQFVSTVVKVYEKCLKRRKCVIEKLLAGKLDKDQMVEHSDFMETQSEVLTCLVDCIGYTLKTLKELFVPIFEDLVFPSFYHMLIPSGSVDTNTRLGAICLFDDCVEYCGQFAAAKYGQFLVNAVTEGIMDGDVGIREASVYGIAQLARHAPSSYLEAHAENLAKHLRDIAVEGTQKAKEDIEHIRLVENSLSALATMTLFKSSPFPQISISKAEIIKIFLANLPLKEDCDEAKFNHNGFCDLVESGEINVEESLGTIMQVIGEIATAFNDGFEIATKETHNRLIGIIALVQNQVDNALLQQIYSNLTTEAQHGIMLLMDQTG
jgi:hypothetical protein